MLLAVSNTTFTVSYQVVSHTPPLSSLPATPPQPLGWGQTRTVTRKGVVAAGSMVGFFSVTPLGMLRLCPHLSGGDSGDGTQTKGQLQTQEHRNCPGTPAGHAKRGFFLGDALANEPTQQPHCFPENSVQSARLSPSTISIFYTTVSSR